MAKENEHPVYEQEMNNAEWVILVDEHDVQIGIAEKLIAHQQNLLHRAFSVFIFRQNAAGEWEILLQQRAANKYHSPNLWTNTCCSHPRPGETVVHAAARRLKEELGLETELKHAGSFQYHAPFSNGLSEHEYDHVLVGLIKPNTPLTLNKDEVQATCWLTPTALSTRYQASPQQFTLWLMQAFDLAYAALLDTRMTSFIF